MGRRWVTTALLWIRDRAPPLTSTGQVRVSLRHPNYPQKRGRYPQLSTSSPQLGVKPSNMDISTQSTCYLIFCSHLNSVGEFGDLVIDRTPLSHQLADLPIGMHHSGVITPSEGLANLWQGELSKFAAKVHRDLAGIYKDSRTRGST